MVSFLINYVSLEILRTCEILCWLPQVEVGFSQHDKVVNHEQPIMEKYETNYTDIHQLWKISF